MAVSLRLRAIIEAEARKRAGGEGPEAQRHIRWFKNDDGEWVDGRLDPAGWIWAVLGIRLEPYQVEIAESIRDNRRTAVKSCHSIGKDYTAAAIVIWFLCCFDPSKVITTAPTDRQVKRILWGYIRAMVRGARRPLPPGCLTQFWEVKPDHFALGFTASEYDHNAAQGYHSNNILVIYDESTGVEGEARKGLDSALSSGDNARALDIANPTNKHTTFGSLFDREDVNAITVSAFDTPNFTEFGITLEDYKANTWREKITGPLPAPYLVTPEWVGEQWEAARHDEEDADFRSRVLGLFADNVENAVFPESWVDAAMERGAELLEGPPPEAPAERGADVARLGKDDSVAADFHVGWGVAPLIPIPKGDTMETVGWLISHLEGLARLRIDADGLGAGIFDRVLEVLTERWGAERAEAFVIELRSGRKALDPTRYPNRRSEMLWTLREMIDPKGDWKLALPPDDMLKAELCAIQYKTLSDGRKQVEPKDDTKQRLKRSPDRADAVAYSVARGDDPPPAPAPPDPSMIGGARQRNQWAE